MRCRFAWLSSDWGHGELFVCVSAFLTYVACLSEPLWVLFGLSELEALLAEQDFRLETAVVDAQDLREWVDLPYHRLHLTQLHLIHEVHLVEKQDVSKLDLVHEELCDSAPVACAGLPAAVHEFIQASKLLEQRCRVDDRHEVAQARNLSSQGLVLG